MYKYYFLASLMFSGCSSMTYSSTMCDEINSDPNSVMPKECRAYDKVKAEKAFNKIEKEKESKKDTVEFNK